MASATLPQLLAREPITVFIMLIMCTRSRNQRLIPAPCRPRKLRYFVEDHTSSPPSRTFPCAGTYIVCLMGFYAGETWNRGTGNRPATQSEHVDDAVTWSSRQFRQSSMEGTLTVHLTRDAERPFKMYPVGVLFGLGEKLGSLEIARQFSPFFRIRYSIFRCFACPFGSCTTQ